MRSLLLLLALLVAPFSHSAAADKPPLLFEDDFRKGAGHWQPTDPAVWKVIDTDKGKAYSQFAQSKYKPPHRSPFNFALIKDLVVGDCVLEAQVQSTSRDYPHRDMCVVFGYQDPAHFYYVHLGKKTDDHANQIFIVNDAPRTKISTKTTDGTPWTDGWHHVKVVRRLADGGIEVYFDDMKTPAMTARDKTFTWGQVGVGSFDDTGNWTDVKVYGTRAERTPRKDIDIQQTDEFVEIDTNALHARIQKKGYVSGIARGSFLDKKTGARDIGFGLHIMDFLMAPGWRDDGYPRDPKVHGDLPKHYVEGPQICTQAKALTPEIIRGEGFVAVQVRYTFHKPGPGYQAGSTWKQTLVFQPGVRYVLSSEEITSVNAVEDLFYRIDMPGHVRHNKADTFTEVYLSYAGKPIPASEFAENFGPDARFLYQRKNSSIPARMIRAYRVKQDGKPGPWLAGMTLDPAEVSEAWCHQRGYVCFIEELHRRPVKAGETFGAAYVVGWFADIAEMEKVYDRYKGARAIRIQDGKFRLE